MGAGPGVSDSGLKFLLSFLENFREKEQCRRLQQRARRLDPLLKLFGVLPDSLMVRVGLIQRDGDDEDG